MLSQWKSGDPCVIANHWDYCHQEPYFLKENTHMNKSSMVVFNFCLILKRLLPPKELDSFMISHQQEDSLLLPQGQSPYRVPELTVSSCSVIFCDHPCEFRVPVSLFVL